MNAVEQGYHIGEIGNGLSKALLDLETPDEIAASVATSYDRSILALMSTALIEDPPRDYRRRVETSVARVPKAPYFTLLSLTLIQALGSVALTLFALRIIHTKQGVRDTQVRLSSAAIIAESFENPALSDSAKDIDDLFAERRGLPTRKIALVKNVNGGRKFKLIVESPNRVSPTTKVPHGNSAAS